MQVRGHRGLERRRTFPGLLRESAELKLEPTELGGEREEQAKRRGSEVPASNATVDLT